MYGVGPGFTNVAGSPGDPIGPDIANQNDWWFRGPGYRALKPQNDSVMDLPAGGKVDIEISCNVAFTSYGVSPSNLSDPLAACPGNSGAFHSGVPGEPIDDALLSGCALAIADKDDIEQVGWDDLAVFSVQQRCVRDRVTTFEIPEQMPKCTGEKCICCGQSKSNSSQLPLILASSLADDKSHSFRSRLANNGTGNFYMTGFDCSVTPGSSPLPILPPVDPSYCPQTNTTCVPAKGAKRPLYAYNSPSNIEWQGNDKRPGYHPSWSFLDGAQNDIFDRTRENVSTSVDSSLSSTVLATRSVKASATKISSAKEAWTRVGSASSHTAEPLSTKTVALSSSSRLTTSRSDSPYSIEPLPTNDSSASNSSTTRSRSSSISSSSSAALQRIPPTSSSTFSSEPTPPCDPNIGQALKLELPTFEDSALTTSHNHRGISHNGRQKRNLIEDELLDQQGEYQSSASSGHVLPAIAFLSFLALALLLTLLQ
ncbi:hypothetical protein JCM16303_002834 [Sporobolomyces ruberrimus]